MLTSEQIFKYKKEGFLHLKNFFSKKEMIDVRDYIIYNYHDQNQDNVFCEKDLLSDDYLQKILLNDKVIEIVKSLLGKNITYFGDSGWNISKDPTPSVYHTDNADRDSHGEDWDGDYPLTRFAIYLQNHANIGGGPLLGSGSHNKFIKNHYLRVLYQETLGPLLGKFQHIPANLGDIVFWNLRTSHAGSGFIFKKTNFPISKRLSKFIPNFITSKYIGNRILVHGTFGSKSKKLDRYIKYLKTRTYQIDLWKKNNSSYSEEVYNSLKNKNIEFLNFSKTINEDIASGKISLNDLNDEHQDIL